MSSSEAAELQAAIQQGNIEQSQLIARQLAEAKAKVIIRIDNGSNAVMPDITDAIRCSIFLSLFLWVWEFLHFGLLQCMYGPMLATCRGKLCASVWCLSMSVCLSVPFFLANVIGWVWITVWLKGNILYSIENNNNNNHDSVYGAIIMTKVIVRV